MRAKRCRDCRIPIKRRKVRFGPVEDLVKVACLKFFHGVSERQAVPFLAPSFHSTKRDVGQVLDPLEVTYRNTASVHEKIVVPRDLGISFASKLLGVMCSFLTRQRGIFSA